MKIDKAKKERLEKAAATASAKGKAKEVDTAAGANGSPSFASISISAPPKSKSKAPPLGSAPVPPTISTTPGEMLPPPFTSAPRMPAMPMAAEPSPQIQPQHLHEEDDIMDIEGEPVIEDEDVDVDEVDEEEAEGEVVVQDMITVEEDEIRRDAKGLEEHPGDD